MKLTPANIKRLEDPQQGRKDKLYFDEVQRGLAVRVTGSGTKSFLCHFTVNGRKRRIPLGSCNSITLAQARELTRGYMVQVALGNDPFFARKSAKRDALTLEELLESWQTLHLATRRPRYAGEAVRALRYAFRDHLALPAGDLSRKAVIGAIDAMALKKSASTALLVAYGKALFNWAIKRDVLASNPFVNLAVAPTRKRERVLSDEELAAIWRATDGVGAYNAIVMMLILTGQRRSEVSAMRWEELSSDLATWTIPSQRTKNRRAHVVPLSQPARDLLHSVPRFNELVFPGLRGRQKSISTGTLG
jgi:integrase